MDLSRLEDLFHRCRELPPEEREAFLARECGGSGELAEKVRKLLAHAASPDGDEADALGPFVARFPEPAEPTSLVGRAIGGYDVEQTLASGGMGAVFTAIQRSTKRRVALKILKPELMGAALVRRFSLEVEVLGRLHHPNIAQVFDGGTETVDSATIPYFAMEFVPNARPIHAFVRERALEIGPTLALFKKVCRGVEHAHLQGVIHRDLKPENILIDGEDADAEPKVIDFGIARFSEEGAGGTLLTSPGQIIGTLETMSPVQARGAADEIDVRTDVYALGVVLYQMLTGEAPLAVRGKSVPDALRTILETAPANPSKLRKAIRPELDAIVMKCLAKSSDDRYESVRALREDVLAFIEGRTVSARAPTTFELLRMTARRHRAILIPASLVFAVAIAAAVVSTRFAIEANRRADEMNRLAYRANLDAASAAIDDSDVTAAERLLADAPEHLRGWEWRHLWSRIHEEVATFEADRGQPADHCFAVTKDYYATASLSDSTVQLWNARTGDRVRVFPLEGRPVWLAFEGDDDLLVLGLASDGDSFYRFSVDGRERESWDVPSMLNAPHAKKGRNWFVLYAGGPIRNLVAWLRWEPMGVALYDIAAKEVIAQRSFPGVLMGDGCSLGAGRWLVAAWRDSRGRTTAEILEAPSLSTVRVLDGLGAGHSVFMIGADGRFVATGAEDRKLYVWDLERPTSEPAYTIALPERADYPVLSDDGRLLAISRADRKVTVVELESGTVLGTVETPFWPGDQDQARLASSGQISFWGMKSFRPGSHVLYLAPDDGPVQVWDFGRRDPRRLAAHASYVYPVRITSSGGFVLSGGWDGLADAPGCLRWTDLASGTPLAERGPPGVFVLDAVIAPSETEALVSLDNWLLDAHPESEDPLGVSARAARRQGRLGTLARVSMTSGDVLAAYTLPARIMHVDADPAFKRAICGDDTGGVHVLDLGTGEVLHESSSDWPQMLFGDAVVAWSPDGRWIVVAQNHRRVEVWDGSSYEVVATLPGHDAPIRAASFDAGSRRVLTASDDRTVKVWSVPEGVELARLTGLGAGALCARFSPDGARIAAGGRGGELRLWRGDTYEPLTSLHLHESYIKDLAWTSDGQTLVTGSGDGTVRVWETTPIRDRVAAWDARATVAERVAPAIEAAFRAGADPNETWRRMVPNPDAPTREEQVIWQEILRRSVHGIEPISSDGPRR